MVQNAPSGRRRAQESSLGRVVFDDLRRTDFGRDWLRELKDLYSFYLDDERRERLAEMGRVRRAFSMFGWLFKSLMMKLSPARRLMLLAALVFGVLGWTGFTVSTGTRVALDFRPWGFVLLLIVLMLELRELAR